MIKSARIENFLSHKDTFLIFAPGVNVIHGATDGGKSSILRAMIWNMFNRPRGTSFRSWWGGNTKVRISIEDTPGQQIDVCRERAASANRYSINDEQYEAMGTDVPEPVQEVLNVGEINVQHQFDAPFMLTETSGEVARQLNKIANLEQIDVALHNVDAMLRENNKEIGFAEVHIQSCKQEVEQFADLPEIEKALSSIEKEWSTYIEKKRSLAELSETVTEIRDAQANIERSHDMTGARKAFAELEKLLTEIEAAEKRIRAGDDLSDDIENTQKKLAKIPEVGNDREALDEMEEAIADLKEQQKAVRGLTFVSRCIKSTKNELTSQETEVERLRNSLNELMPDTCPLCGAEKGDSRA